MRPTRGSASKCRREYSGFSLIELTIVLVVIAVLAVIAVPRYLDYAAKVRLAGHAQFVLETLRLARIEAVTRELPVSVCASTDGVSCTGTPWEQGWLVFSDEGTAGVIDGDDIVLRTVAAYEGGVTLDVSSPTSDIEYFQFDPKKIMVARLRGIEPDEKYNYAQLASDLAAKAVLAMLGIDDAFANKKPKKHRRRKKWAEVCAKPGSEHNPHCEEPLAVLEFCTDSRNGETGTAVRAVANGDAVSEEIDCE
jgi:prepilin-type N-terminal cleavage/methylation domain-containing protein